MKTISFFKIKMFFSALILAGLAVMSFQRAEKKGTATDTIYYYVSSETGEGDFAVPAHWSTVDANGSCGSPQPIRPCQISLSGSNTLSSVLSGKSNAAVLEMSVGFKGNPE